MTKLILEIETDSPQITREFLNDFMKKDTEKVNSFIWLDEGIDLPWGKRKGCQHR